MEDFDFANLIALIERLASEFLSTWGIGGEVYNAMLDPLKEVSYDILLDFLSYFIPSEKIAEIILDGTMANVLNSFFKDYALIDLVFTAIPFIVVTFAILGLIFGFALTIISWVLDIIL